MSTAWQSPAIFRVLVPLACASRFAAAAAGPGALRQSRSATLAVHSADCPVCQEPEQVGTTGPELPELSGMASSRQRPDVYYVVNDSPKSPKLYAMNEQGHVVQTIIVTNTVEGETFGRWGFGDWESVSVGPCGRGDAAAESKSCIYIGDIGHNCARESEDCPYHRDTYSIIRLPEPASNDREVSVRGERFFFRYDDGSHDAEAIAVVPSGDIYVLTKQDFGRSGLYRLAGPLASGVTATARRLLTLDAHFGFNNVTGPALFLNALGVAMGPDAKTPIGVAVHSRTKIAYYPMVGGDDLPDALAKEPCFLPLPQLVQSEVIAWNKIGGASFYLTSSEATGSPVWKVRCDFHVRSERGAATRIPVPSGLVMIALALGLAA